MRGPCAGAGVGVVFGCARPGADRLRGEHLRSESEQQRRQSSAATLAGRRAEAPDRSARTLCHNRAAYDVVGVVVRRGVPRPLPPPRPRVGPPRGGLRPRAPADRSPTPLLDLCCGSGRHSIPLAEAGSPPVGLDYSAPLLDLARQRDRHLAPRPRRHARASLPRRRVPHGRQLLHELRLLPDRGREHGRRRRDRARAPAAAARFSATPSAATTCSRASCRRSAAAAARRSTGSAAPGTPRRARLEKEIEVRRAGSTEIFRESVRAYTADELVAPARGRGPARRDGVGRLRRDARRPRLAAPDRPRAQAGETLVIPYAKYPGLSPLFLEFLAGAPESLSRSAHPRRRRRARTSSCSPRDSARASRPRPSDVAAPRRSRWPRSWRRAAPSPSRRDTRSGLFTGPALHAHEGVRRDPPRARALAARRAGGPGLLGADRRPRPAGDRADGAADARGARRARPRGRRPPEPPARRPAPDPGGHPRRRRRLPPRRARRRRTSASSRPSRARSAPGTLYGDAFIETLLDLVRPGSAARARAARRGRCARRRSRSSSTRPARPTPCARPCARPRRSCAQRGQPGPGARSRRGSRSSRSTREGRRRIDDVPAAVARVEAGRGLALGRRHNPAGPEVVSLPHGGQRSRRGGDRVPRAEPSALPALRRDAARCSSRARTSCCAARPSGGWPSSSGIAEEDLLAAARRGAAARRARGRRGRRAGAVDRRARSRRLEAPLDRARRRRSPARSKRRARRSPTSSSSSPSAPARPPSARADVAAEPRQAPRAGPAARAAFRPSASTRRSSAMLACGPGVARRAAARAPGPTRPKARPSSTSASTAEGGAHAG